MATTRTDVPNSAGTQEIWQSIVAAAKDGRPTIRDENDEISLERSIDRLPNPEIGRLFGGLSSLIHSELSSARSDPEREQVKHKYRKLFGVRYSAMLLTSIALDGELAPAAESDQVLKSARAIVEESLQWQQDAVLAHVLIYYKDRSGEDLFHECAVLAVNTCSEQELEHHLMEFRTALREYVRIYGSSVRTKEHLRLAVLPCESSISGVDSEPLRTAPLEIYKSVRVRSDELQLPTDDGEAREGNESKYREVVWNNLGALLQLDKESFAFVHFSAGSDDVGEASVRATAHLYVVFRKRAEPLVALDYKFAMREALSRLTISFALDRLNRANNKLIETRKTEQQQHKKFELRIQEMRADMRKLQAQAEGIISLVNPTVWESLINWISYIEEISSDANLRPKTIFVGELISTPSEHSWGDAQWAMALLKLVNAVEEDFPPNLKLEAPAAWGYLCQSVRNKVQQGIYVHPIWRCLDRMGFPTDGTGISDLAAKIKASCKFNEKDLRRSFMSPEAENQVFSNNGFSVLALRFALGSEYYPPIEGGVECAKVFYLPELLRVSHVMNGMNMLHDLLNDKRFAGKRSAQIWIDHAPVLTLRVQLDFGHTEGGGTFAVFETMRNLKAKYSAKYPGSSVNTTSFAVFLALGIEEDSWVENLRGVEFNSDSVAYKPQNGTAVAWCTKGANSLNMSYLVTTTPPTKRRANEMLGI